MKEIDIKERIDYQDLFRLSLDHPGEVVFGLVDKHSGTVELSGMLHTGSQSLVLSIMFTWAEVHTLSFADKVRIACLELRKRLEDTSD